MSLVVGIDPSSRTLAVAEMTLDGHLDGFCMVEAPRKMKDRTEVCHYLFVSAQELLRPGSYLFIEQPLVGRGGVRSTMVQAEIQGVLRVAAVECGITHVYSVNVQTWKKAVIGRGNATKDEVREWWRDHHPRSDLYNNQDLIDAACIATYGVDVLARGNRLAGGTPPED